jgi:demethylmenaquinone methyltransferase/2-methoxy-6-polyprenyl-1,4-benzoquinol methylase
MPNLYDPRVIKKLFDEMAGTYGLVNVVSSFGLCRRWRRQCLRSIRIPRGAAAIDMMSGMGELCPDLSVALGPEGRIIAIDISASMCQGAARLKLRCPLELLQEDVLAHGFEPGSADLVVSSFGLKTFSAQQVKALARVIAAALKPGGVFSFIEISVPSNRWLRGPYLFYLDRIIPLVGALFLGNPDCYRQLGIYTRAFGSCAQAARHFRAAGLETEERTFFFGCATGLRGRRPG